uniref:AlNc14C313G10507 protein n=2 Tax=Albugo laibachii Nc14 TaxID=890382 RepID=F0WW65_9STRA|nr:AlNc14C313G10507 [Albugo laibachii Nc14]|eukprot:CCA25684.1 AlNc14C313G10507 [Albugo laibachii Nc14]
MGTMSTFSSFCSADNNAHMLSSRSEGDRLVRKQTSSSQEFRLCILHSTDLVIKLLLYFRSNGNSNVGRVAILVQAVKL